MDSFLVVGLGNPGARYSNTRHNAGTDFVLALAKKHETELTEKKNIKSQVAQLHKKNYKVYLAVPQVFMNHSGISVKLLKSKYSIEDKNITTDLWKSKYHNWEDENKEYENWIN